MALLRSLAGRSSDLTALVRAITPASADDALCGLRILDGVLKLVV